ncbi:hypothetical protein GGF31_008571 [Allomyces arbusculus]|nr:hypothetical protein GGF31_008571 [Allomyces arbusculus]
MDPPPPSSSPSPPPCDGAAAATAKNASPSSRPMLPLRSRPSAALLAALATPRNLDTIHPPAHWLTGRPLKEAGVAVSAEDVAIIDNDAEWHAEVLPRYYASLDVNVSFESLGARTDLAPDEVEAILTAFRNYLSIGDSVAEFALDVFLLTRWERLGLVLAMARQLYLPQLLHVSYGRLLAWVLEVEAKYLDPPYHSFIHAVDVALIVYFTLYTLHGRDLVTDLDAALCFMAALCHDMGHPGRNNLYMINSRDPLAIKYKNVSVLESYSVELGRISLLKHGMLDHLTPAARDAFLDRFRDVILGTDMATHFARVKELGELSRQLLALDAQLAAVPEESASTVGSDTSESTPKAAPAADAPPQQDSPPLHPSHKPHFLRRIAHRNSAPPDLLPPPTSSRDLDADPALALRRPVSDSYLVHDEHPSSATGLPTPPDSASTAATGGKDAPPLVVEDEPLLTTSERIALVRCVLHAADISNTVRPWDLCKKWSDLVLEELYAQGDVERIAGLPISPNTDRSARAQGQFALDFSDVIIEPFFVLLADVIPAAEIYIDQLATNRTRWDKIRQLEAGLLSPSQLQFPTTATVSSSLDEYTTFEQPHGVQHGPKRRNPRGDAPPATRRVSVAAGTLAIPEQYFAAAGPAVPPVPPVPPLPDVHEESEPTSPVAATTPPDNHTDSGVSPTADAPSDAPAPTPAAAAPSPTSAPAFDPEFDALYLGYLARARSRTPTPAAAAVQRRRNSLEGTKPVLRPAAAAAPSTGAGGIKGWLRGTGKAGHSRRSVSLDTFAMLQGGGRRSERSTGAPSPLAARGERRGVVGEEEVEEVRGREGAPSS